MSGQYSLEREVRWLRILRVNMSQLKVAYEELPKEWLLIGGRGLIAKIMNKEVPPDAEPLGAENKLIIAGGPLAGTIAPQLGRISVGAKSPLTLGIKESNAGGPAAQKLDKLGIRAIIVEDVAEGEKLYCLKISKDEAVLVPADEYKGMKNYRLVEELYKKYDRKPAIISIGTGSLQLGVDIVYSNQGGIADGIQYAEFTPFHSGGSLPGSFQL